MTRLPRPTLGFLPLLILTTLLGALGGGGLSATPALHLHLTRSSPAEGATLTEAPAEIRLWFSETPERAVSMIRLEGPAGQVELAELQAGDEDSLTAAVEGSMGGGDYTVSWRTSSGDGHPVRGSFAFTLAGR